MGKADEYGPISNNSSSSHQVYGDDAASPPPNYRTITSQESTRSGTDYYGTSGGRSHSGEYKVRPSISFIVF
jgi:hypothetical protein